MRSRRSRIEGLIATLRQAWGDGLTTGDGKRMPTRASTSPRSRCAGRRPRSGSAAAASPRSGAWRGSPTGTSGAASPRPPSRSGSRWIHDEAATVGRDPAEIEIGVHRVVFAWRDGDAWSRVGDAARYMNWKYPDMGRATRFARARPAGPRRRPEPGGRAQPHDRRDPEQVAEQIRAYAPTLGERGLFVFRGHLPGLDPAVQREAFDLLVNEVVPLVGG